MQTDDKPRLVRVTDPVRARPGVGRPVDPGHHPLLRAIHGRG